MLQNDQYLYLVTEFINGGTLKLLCPYQNNLSSDKL